MTHACLFGYNPGSGCGTMQPILATGGRLRPIGVLMTAVLASLLLSPALALAGSAPSKPTGKFGAVDAFRAGEQASAAGLSWQRVSFLWSGLQPKGPDDWNPFFFPDDQLNAELESGRTIVGMLMAPPSWANGTGNAWDPPKNFALAPDDPNNLWTLYVKKVVGTYKGRIDTWIISLFFGCSFVRGSSPDDSGGIPRRISSGTTSF